MAGALTVGLVSDLVRAMSDVQAVLSDGAHSEPQLCAKLKWLLEDGPARVQLLSALARLAVTRRALRDVELLPPRNER